MTKTTPARDRKTLSELCQSLCKSTVYVRNLQTALDLHRPSEREGYSLAYEAFLRTVIALRTFSVPIDEIVCLFISEKKLLTLLKIDSLSKSPTWYLDQCGGASSIDSLLLTNYSLGGSVTEAGVQSNLDFSNRNSELFKSSEMGEDARRMLASCRKSTSSIMMRVGSEIPVLKLALSWAGNKSGTK